MGTNYYLRTTPCPTCGHSPNDLHIGKSSVGWYFALRVYPDVDGCDAERLKPFDVKQIRELDDWRPLFEKFPVFDEYEHPVTVEDLLKEITERSHPRGLLSRLTAGPEHMGPYHDPKRPDLKAGAGTYDLCAYEFS
jgi:hypothetical protein